MKFWCIDIVFALSLPFDVCASSYGFIRCYVSVCDMWRKYYAQNSKWILLLKLCTYKWKHLLKNIWVLHLERDRKRYNSSVLVSFSQSPYFYGNIWIDIHIHIRQLIASQKRNWFQSKFLKLEILMEIAILWQNQIPFSLRRKIGCIIIFYASSDDDD